jgi:adenosylmethionine-8-amino-7-oxononanoate aminotransferase
MTDFIILGTDTDAGKTTFALIWLAAFGDQYEYWKPIETGDSDCARIEALCVQAVVHPPMLRLQEPVAPPLAARIEGLRVPPARDIAAACPRTLNAERALVIETFGGPFSPLNEDELQLTLIRALARPCLLVSSTKLGAIGRTLQCLRALQSEGVLPFAVVLLGDHDPFAVEQIGQHSVNLPVVSLQPPHTWTTAGLQACAAKQLDSLRRLHTAACSSNQQECQPHALIAEDHRCVWHPYTALVDAEEPLACIGAQDEFLHLADGRKIIDGISSWWTILHGHRHPPLMQALVEATRRLDHVLFAGVTHPDAIELADLLLGTMPWVGGRVFYSDNGSTAVEVALKMAYQFWCHQGEPQRTRFVGFEHGYHGDTFGAMAVGRDPLFFGLFEPLLFRADILPLEPARLDEHLDRHAQQIAAVILEPLVQGAGGMRMHSSETLRQIVEITQRHGVLFIADEVMTGGGRTGTLWAHQAAGVVPDLLCAGKTLTGGVLPLSATLAAPNIVKAFTTADRTRTFFHGHSFTANPLACAVAVRNYRMLLANPLDAPHRIERFWKQSLARLKAHPRVKDLRIRGSIAAIEIDADGGYLAEAGRAMRRVCLERGVLLRPLGSVLYALPPYGASDESLQRIADAMIAAVNTL